MRVLMTGSPTSFRAVRLLLPLALATALACVTAVATYGVLLLPAQVRLSELMRALEIEQVMERRQHSAQRTQQILHTIWQQLPVRKEFMGLGVAIADLANHHRVRVPTMGYEIEQIKKYGVKKGILTFDVAGRYEAIRRFIYQLETTWPHLFIEKLSVKRSKRTNDVAFHITLATYLRPEAGTRKPTTRS
ncbi:MAG: hypothetical protein D6690_15430 [Nitrospirae bacterium]|nr:MAG: hypothetical protein D6690_15430 [Nitrospirota bacterium]